MSTEDNKSNPRLLKIKNLFEEGDSVASARDVGLSKMRNTSETKVIPLKTTGIRVPGNHRRESYILQTDLKEVRGTVGLKRFNDIPRGTSSWRASPSLRKPKITPSVHGKSCINDMHQSHFEMTSMKSDSVNQRFNKSSKCYDAKSRVSILLKIYLTVSLLALLFHGVAISLNLWMSSEFSQIGLWEVCIVHNCGSYKSVTPVMQASQAFNVLGFLAGGFTVLLIIVYVLCLTNKKTVRLAGNVASFVTAGLILTGIIIMGGSDLNQGLDVGWAMISAIIGAILYVAVGILIVFDLVLNKTP